MLASNTNDTLAPGHVWSTAVEKNHVHCGVLSVPHLEEMYSNNSLKQKPKMFSVHTTAGVNIVCCRSSRASHRRCFPDC